MRITSWMVAMALVALPGSSWAQAHAQKFGDYTVRSSTVGSQHVSPSTAKEHGIERSPKHAVVNVTVMKNDQAIPAQVSVTAQNLTGLRRQIDMKETKVGNYVSYTGSYDFVHGEVIDFTVQATPRGSDKVLTMSYRERMWGPGDLPDTGSR